MLKERIVSNNWSNAEKYIVSSSSAMIAKERIVSQNYREAEQQIVS